MRKFDRSLPMALLKARESAMTLFRPSLNEFGLTEQQWRVIRVLQEHGAIEFRELSRICCIQPPSLTGILTRLERDALVRRKRSAIDQRRLHVSLTRKGVGRFNALSDQVELSYQVLEKQLGRARFRMLMGILDELTQLELPNTSAKLQHSSSGRKPARDRSLSTRPSLAGKG